MSAEIKLLANKNEGATSRDITGQTEKCRKTSSVFINVLQANKIISKNKKVILPTKLNIKKHITGNTYISFFGLRYFFLSFAL